MTTFISIEPTRDVSFSEDDVETVLAEVLSNTGGKIEEDLMRAYINVATRYKNNFVKKAYPAIPVIFFDRQETIRFDPELDATIMKIYILYGWNGIIAVQNAIGDDKTLKEDVKPLVIKFFTFTRNRLLVLIREEIIRIEKRASQEITTQLSLTSIALLDGYQKLKFKKNEVSNTPSSDEGIAYTKIQDAAGGGTAQGNLPGYYSIEDKPLAEKIYTTIKKYLVENNCLTHLSTQRKILIRQIELLEKQKKQKYSGKSAGVDLPSDILFDPGVMSSEEKKEALKAIEQLSSETTKLIEELKREIGEESAIILLAVPQLSEKKDFTREALEEIIGSTIWNFHIEVDRLGDKIDPVKSQFEMDFPFQNINFEKEIFLNRYEADFCYEEKCIKNAIEKAAEKEIYLPLICEQVLHKLINDYPEKFGSFSHIVTVHYLAELNRQLEANRRREEFIQNIATFFATVSAALSLISAFSKTTLVGLIISAPLEFVSKKMLGIPLMIYMSYSIVHQLSLLDEKLNQRLIEADSKEMESLLRLGEIMVMRKEYSSEIISQFAQEIILMIVGGKFEVFKRILHYRGYYLDLSTFSEIKL